MRANSGLGASIDEINLTLDRALGFIDPFFGSCIRFDYIDQAILNNLINGCIIQWNQLKSSYRYNEGMPFNQFENQGETNNVIFHIYSKTGRSIQAFSMFNTTDKREEIVFPPGTQFYVCKKDQD